jgi:hypothetical protein
MWWISANRLAAIGIMALMSGQRVEADDSFSKFQSAFRCDVIERLKLIYATGDPINPLNRYLVISTSSLDYVQCIFHDRNSRVRCEASSGYWTTKPGGERTVYKTPRTIAALARLGFDTNDSSGNFRVDRAVGQPIDFTTLTDLMLRALHDGYGERNNSKLTFKAPFATKRPAACVPIS